MAEGQAARDTVREGQDRVLGWAAAGWVGAAPAGKPARAVLAAAGCGRPEERPELAGEELDPVVVAARVLAPELVGEELDQVEPGAARALAPELATEELDPVVVQGLAEEVARGAAAEAREAGLVVDLEREAGPEVGVQVSVGAGARVVAGRGEELARARRGSG